VAQSKTGMFMLQKQLIYLGFDLSRIYGPEYQKNGIAFMYDENKQEILQILRSMWTDMGDYLSR
jgi:hypothetical protein